MRKYLTLFFCAAFLYSTTVTAEERDDEKWNSIFAAAIISATKQSGGNGVRTTCTEDTSYGKTCITTATFINNDADLVVFAFHRDFNKNENTKFICKYRTVYEVCSTWDDLLTEQCRKKNAAGVYDWYLGTCPIHLF